jgi:hypothetical protein
MTNERTKWGWVAFALTLAFIRADDTWACEAPVDHTNNRIEIKKDGAFENGNFSGKLPFAFDPFLDNAADTVSGNAVVDRGNGRVAQRLFFSSYGCSGDEALLVVDCVARETILLAGAMPPSDRPQIAGYSWTEIVWIQAPHGPINITPNTTLGSLRKTAERHNIGYVLNAEEILGNVKKRDRYDVFYGCKLFYPELAEASP